MTTNFVKHNTRVLAKARYAALASLAFLLSACASNNALLQSPVANTTDTVAQIERDLSQALAEPTTPPALAQELPEHVLGALEPALSPVSPVVQEPRFDIAVEQVPASDFFNGLVAGTNQNIVVHPGLTGNISLTLKDVTLEEVLEVTREIYGFEFAKRGNLVTVYPAGPRTKIFNIDYLDVQRQGGSEMRVSSGQITQNAGSSGDSSGSSSAKSATGTQINTKTENKFWQQLKSTLALIIADEDQASVVVTPSAGVVVVRASAEGLSAVESYLQKAELIMQRQVILEAKILEVELNDSYQQGIDWSFAEAGEFTAGGTARRSIDLGLGARAVASGTAGGIFASTVRLGNFNTTIDLLGTQGNVQVLSSPRIATVNNQKAVIKVGSDEYFVTEIEFESDSDADTSNTDIELTPFFSGIALDVTPQISEEGQIILHVHPTISEVEDQEKTISISGRDINLPLAFSRIRESDSVITAEDGQIVVLGGLIQSKSEDDNSAVPFFSDIPVLGELFKQKYEKASKTELVILLRPTITDAANTRADISASKARFGQLKQLLERAAQPNF